MSEVEGFDDVAEPDGGRPIRPPLTPAQKRARRQAITLLLVGGLLLVSFLFAAAYYGGWFSTPQGQDRRPAPCPTTTAVSTVQPSQVHVNVYNASNRNGLAKKVAGEMKTPGLRHRQGRQRPAARDGQDAGPGPLRRQGQGRRRARRLGGVGRQAGPGQAQGRHRRPGPRRDVRHAGRPALGDRPAATRAATRRTTPSGTPTTPATPTGTKTTKKA